MYTNEDTTMWDNSTKDVIWTLSDTILLISPGRGQKVLQREEQPTGNLQELPDS